MNLQKKLIELQKDPVANEEEIRQVQIAMQTNGLTDISKADCEKLVQAITAMLEEK